jgi:hypothetical protein
MLTTMSSTSRSTESPIAGNAAAHSIEKIRYAVPAVHQHTRKQVVNFFATG